MRSPLDSGFDPEGHPAICARQADAGFLAAALVASRQDVLATFSAFEAALPGLTVPQQDSLNPPLWELGHMGWFQEFWIARNPQRAFGHRANADAPRSTPQRADADALYDSGKVPHASRWSLPLPGAQATSADLATQLEQTLAHLQTVSHQSPQQADALYFFRLALLHEDMHHEAALHTAQNLGVAVGDARWQASAVKTASKPIPLAACDFVLGSQPHGLSAGFVFDNELTAHKVALPATQIDSQVLRWAEYLPFVEDGGYANPRWWCEAGQAWLAAEKPTSPRYTRREGWTWQRCAYGVWQNLDLHLPACHLTAFEASAWCRWAGRRLPSEAEWERAAVNLPADFDWGQVWEWTASAFLPYPGFVAHPYRDYSAPWFGPRWVLRGGSFMTQARMRHPRYRNFFAAHRNDVPAGFRTCSL
jgi:gamma-glutamyl hercynylcysteine S-oxide synthase